MMDWPADWDDIVEVRLHVLKRNVAAVALYRKWGFEVVQTTVNYFIGRSVLRMAKKIATGGVVTPFGADKGGSDESRVFGLGVEEESSDESRIFEW